MFVLYVHIQLYVLYMYCMCTYVLYVHTYNVYIQLHYTSLIMQVSSDQ